MTQRKSEEQKKSAGRRRRSIFDEMRTIAWGKDMLRRANTNAYGLSELLAKGGENTAKEGIRCDEYLAGKRIPSLMNLNAIHQNKKLARSRSVYEIGPEENGNFVYFWMLFENRYDELWKPIDRVMPSHFTDGIHKDRIDKMACLVIDEDVWRDVQKDGSFKLDPESATEILKSDCVVEMAKLAAVIAMWRLSMLIREGVTQMEYLLRCLLESEPYQALLMKHGIYEHVTLLVRALAVNHYVLVGDLETAASVFPAAGQGATKSSQS